MIDTEKIDKLIHYAKDTRTNAKNYFNQAKEILASAENDLNAANSILDVLLKEKADKTLYDIDLYESRLGDLQDALEMQVYSQEYTVSNVKMMAGITKLFKKGINKEENSSMLVKDLLSVNKLAKPVIRIKNDSWKGEFIYQGEKLNIDNIKVKVLKEFDRKVFKEFIADRSSCLSDEEAINNNYELSDIIFQAEAIINSLAGLKLNEELSKEDKHNFLFNLAAELADEESLGYLLESFSLLDKKGNKLFDYTAPIDLIKWECEEIVINIINHTLLGNNY